MNAVVTHNSYNRYIGDRISDSNLYSTIEYHHKHNGIKVELYEASLCFNPMEQYISDNFDDYWDDNPIQQAFNAIWELIQFNHPEYRVSDGYHAVVYCPQAFFEGNPVYGKDYVVYLDGEDINRNPSTEPLLCNSRQLAVGDTVSNSPMARDYTCRQIRTSEDLWLSNRWSQGYYVWHVKSGAKRTAFERNPESVARYSQAYRAWLWRG